jgi:hypothetical protein
MFLYHGYIDWVPPALQQGLEGNKTFLSASDMLLLEPITKLAFPLACYWLVKHNDDKASSQLRTESFELGPLITPLVLKKMTAASPDQGAIYD